MPLNHSHEYAQLTDSHFQAIGKIVVEWSNIEYLFGLILSHLLFIGIPGRGLIEQMNISQILKGLDYALDTHKNRYQGDIIDPSIISEIKRLRKDVERLKDTRNKVAHLCWMRSNDETISGTRFSIKPNSDPFKISISELNKYYEKSHDIVERLQLIAFYGFPPFDDTKVQKWFKFENSSLRPKGLEDILKYRFQHRTYQNYLKPGKK